MPKQQQILSLIARKASLDNVLCDYRTKGYKM